MAEEIDDLPVLKKSSNGSYEKVYSQGDDLPVLKKKESTKPTTSDSQVTSTGSSDVSSQGAGSSETSGTDSFLVEANKNFNKPTVDQKQAEDFQQGINPALGKEVDKKRSERRLSDKVQLKNTSEHQAAINYNIVEENNKYPAMQEINSLNQELASGVSDERKVAINDRIAQLKSQPVDDSWRTALKGETEMGQPINIPNLKKSAYKTYGEMFDATNKATETFTKLKGDVEKLNAEITPEVKKTRVESAYIPDGKDAQGNEYMKLNPMQSFVHGMGGAMDLIELGLNKVNPLVSREQYQQDLKIKYLKDNVLFPKQAEGIVAKGTEMLGNVAPLIAATVIAPEGIGELAMNALTFGTMDLGSGNYEGFVEAKGNGMTDEEAMKYADKVGAEKGLTGMALGATMPLQGAAGRKLFLNSAEAGAFKTMLAEQGVMIPSFMAKARLDNAFAISQGSERPEGQGVAESGVSAFILAGMTHALVNLPRLPEATKSIYENAIAKNYETLSGVVGKAVESGVVDYATNMRLAEKSKAFETIGKDLDPKLEAKILPKQMEIDRLEKENEGKKGAIAKDNETRIEELNMQIAEDKGSPLNLKEQKRLEDLNAIAKDAEDKLTPTEIAERNHLRKRNTANEKLQAKLEEEKLQADGGTIERGDKSDEKPATEKGDAGTATAPKIEPIKVAGTEVVEHGEDENTAKGLDNGIKPTKLTEKGIEYAKELGKHVKEKGKTLIVTSDVERAKETGKIASEESGAKTESNPNLNTWDIGKFDGEKDGQFDEKYYTEHPEEKPEGGESFNDFKSRMESAYKDVKSYPKDVQVVAHSKVTRAIEALGETDGKWTDETTRKFLKEAEPVTKKLTNKDKAEQERKYKLEVLRAEPDTPQQWIKQFFAGGGRIRTEDLQNETSFGAKDKNDKAQNMEEFRKRIWMHSKKGTSMGRLIENMQEDWRTNHGGELDEQDARNAIIEVMKDHDTPSSMLEDLRKDFMVNDKIVGDKNERLIAKQEKEWADRYEAQQQMVKDVPDDKLQEANDVMDEIDSRPITEEEINALAKEADEYFNSLSKEEQLNAQKQIENESDKGTESEMDSQSKSDSENRRKQQEVLNEKVDAYNKANAEYEKANAALTKDLGNKQVGMFEGKEQKLFDDTKEMSKRVADLKAIRDESKAEMDKAQDIVDSNIKGQMELKEAASTEKHYEQVAGSRPSNQTGRVPVSPIMGGKPKMLRDIIFDITKNAKQRLLFSKPSRGAAGTYSPGNSAVKIRFNGDLDVTAHELGHSIDDHFGILSDLVTTPNLPVEQELNKFSPFGSKPPQGHPNPRMYEYGEGFAEFLRAYIVNPDATKIEAPELTKLYESKVSDSYKKAVSQFSDDIRTWAGASGRDITLANIEVEPQKETLMGKILSKKGNNEFVISWADRVAANFLDPMQAFNKAFEYAKGVKGVDEVLPADDPRILSRLLLGVDGKYGEVLQHGMIDGKNNILLDANGKPKNLTWLFEPLNNTDLSTVKEDAKDVMAYMVAERTVELADKFGRENILSGIGGGVFKDIDVAQKTLDEFKNGDPNRLARIQEAASRYREFADDILKYMVDKGRMSKEAYDDIKANNLQYVGLQRVIESEPDREIQSGFGSGGKLGNKGEPIKKITGSTKTIQNPYTSLIDTLHKAMRESDRNDVLRAFRDMLVDSRGMYEGDQKRFADVGVIGKEGDKNSIPIFINGKPEHWIFQKDVYDALKGLDSEAYKLPELITAFPKIMRWSVTHFPTFAARNIARDFQDRIIKSNEGSGFKELFGDKEHWREIARTGGLNAGYYMRDRASYYGLLEEAMHDMSKTTTLIDPIKFKEMWKGYSNILSKSETVNRVAEYRAAFKNAKAKGMDDYNASIYAGYKSRDLMDFAVMGNYMKIINQVIPFSNASVQGLRKAASSAKENPIGFVARMAAYTVAPGVALWLLNHRDKQTAEEYEALPAYQRDMAWNFKIGSDKWVSIPKPYELSLMGAGVDRTLSSVFYGKENAFSGYAGSVSKSLLPIDQANLIPVAPAAVEGVINYDMFRDKSIVPPYENNLDLSLRKTENASRLGKALQEVSGIDARKIDHFVKGQFSYFGNAAVKVSNIGAEKGEKFGLHELGFFQETPAYNSKQVQDFMDYAQKWNLGTSHPVKEFNRLAKDYFKEKDSDAKDAKAKILRDFAEYQLKNWKASNIEEQKKIKAQRKH